MIIIYLLRNKMKVIIIIISLFIIFKHFTELYGSLKLIIIIIYYNFVILFINEYKVAVNNIIK